MFEDIEEYIKRPKAFRQSHLNLSDDCVEIGGADSRHYRGLMAWFLGTTIPNGMMIYVCHACHNHSCSNPNHLYWGTAKENCADRTEKGNCKSPFQYTVEKYGEERAKEIVRENARKKRKILSSA